jgi:putative transposase
MKLCGSGASSSAKPSNQIRRRMPQARDKWHLDEVAVKIAGVKPWLWRALDQDGIVLDVLVQSRRNKAAGSVSC